MAEQLPCTGCGRACDVGPGMASALCADCAEKLAVQHPQDEHRRPPQPCARCGHNVLIRCAMREFSGEYHNPRPMAATFEVRRGSLLSMKWVDAKNGDPIGLFEAFICRACGYTDWYVHQPEQIPIGLEYGTALVEIPPTKPYR